MMKWIKFTSSLVISYVLGFTLSKGLSATNTLKYKNKILEHNLPFIYTVRLNEIAVIITLTIVGFFIVCSYYEKSESSLEEIFKIMIKVLWSELFLFSFIIGTWTDNLLKILEKDSFYYIYDWNILFFSISVIMFLYICFNQNRIKNKFNVKKESDLYSSRKILLPIIDEYLGSIESISIIGDWGIGKSKLIENFFHAEKDKENKKYSDKYESIIIDVSSYSENKKIISVIQEELVKILMKHKIFKININFVEKVFVENNDFLKSIKNIFFCKDSLIESKENLNKKIEELYTKSKKRIVLCLDNLERLSDVDRIINLLAIIDDITTDNVRKIYIYDKEHMKLIFDKINFENYIEKYSDNFIEVKEIEIKEIVKKPERFDLKRLHFKLRIEQKLEEIKDEELRQRVLQKKEEIEKIMTNPRKIINMEKYIACKERTISQESQIEYKVLIDLFGKFDFNNTVQRIIFFPELTYSYRIKLEEFDALSEGKLILENKKTEQEINEMKIQALKGNSKDIVDYFRYCKENLILDRGKEIFIEIDRYFVDTFDNLKDIIYLVYDDVDIEISKMEIIYRRDFFSSMEYYDLEEAKKLIKSILIRSYFQNFSEISRILFKNLKEYDELYELLPINFEKGLKKNKGINLEEFINSIKKIKKRNIFNLINFEELKEELKILDKIDTMKKLEKSEEKFETKLKEKAFLEMKKFFNLSAICNVSDLNINIKIDYLEINENINEKNIEFYEKHFLKLDKKNHMVKKILMEIYLLKKKIKYSKIKKIRPTIYKFKKYYKNN